MIHPCIVSKGSVWAQSVICAEAAAERREREALINIEQKKLRRRNLRQWNKHGLNIVNATVGMAGSKQPQRGGKTSPVLDRVRNECIRIVSERPEGVSGIELRSILKGAAHDSTVSWMLSDLAEKGIFTSEKRLNPDRGEIGQKSMITYYTHNQRG